MLAVNASSPSTGESTSSRYAASVATRSASALKGTASDLAASKHAASTGVGASVTGAWMLAPASGESATTSPCRAHHARASSPRRRAAAAPADDDDASDCVAQRAATRRRPTRASLSVPHAAARSGRGRDAITR